MHNSSLLVKRSEDSRRRRQRLLQNLLRHLKPGLQDRIRFLGAFLRRPACVGALAPSSQALARAMVRCCAPETSQTVVELGPGTGAFTGLILKQIGKNTKFFAVELDPVFARGLRARFPDLTVYNDTAERLDKYLVMNGEKKADLIVSGLPWASLPLTVQQRIFEAVLKSLVPGGVFATFGYVHARWFPNAQRFRRRLEQHFSRVDESPVVWRNFPPAFIYRCVR
jgi:phosphatidylethanolamine/phosphatidyl-N-methylethanolamine N-methyltransferase